MNKTEPIVLGSGNFSTTFLIEENGKPFVLKKIKSKHLDNPKVIRLFENEANFNFNHQGLPENVKYFHDKGIHYVLKPFIEGKSLEDEKFKPKGAELKAILLKLLDLLIHLEKQKIAHCDIKPSNILVDENGNVSILDFGLAQKFYRSRINFTLFSLGFAAPEIILNKREVVDHRADIYSFGMLMYFLIEGKLPFTDSNPSAFTNLQITHPVPKGRKIKKEIWSIIEKCTAKYQFEIPPNKLPVDQVLGRLERGIDGRYESFNELASSLSVLDESLFNSKRFIF